MRGLSLLLICSLLLSGCASLMNSASSRLANQLGAAVTNSDDPATVRDGLPAYLLLLDGLVSGSPENASTLLAAAELNSAYAGNFVGSDAKRGQRLARKAFDYAKRAVCVDAPSLCKAIDANPETFNAEVSKLSLKQVSMAYSLAAAWAGYVQLNSDDYSAIADLPKVESLLKQVVALDPAHRNGLPYVYLGVLNSLRPAAVGGDPEQGKAYFEKAIALSNGKNLYAKTLQAQFYARLVFDQTLHDKLLNEVLTADAKADGFTLINTLAQQQAQQLLESGKDYF